MLIGMLSVLDLWKCFFAHFSHLSTDCTLFHALFYWMHFFWWNNQWQWHLFPLLLLLPGLPLWTKLMQSLHHLMGDKLWSKSSSSQCLETLWTESKFWILIIFDSNHEPSSKQFQCLLFCLTLSCCHLLLLFHPFSQFVLCAIAVSSPVHRCLLGFILCCSPRCWHVCCSLCYWHVCCSLRCWHIIVFLVLSLPLLLFMLLISSFW